jgi:outer membrane autotransporter protein
VTIYGGWQRSLVFADGQASYGIGNHEIRRSMSAWGTNVDGGTNVRDAGAQIHAGLHLQTPDFTLEPLAGLTILTVSDSGTTESGFGEHISGASTTSFSSLLGGRVGHTFALPTGGNLTTTALVGWEHEYNTTAVRDYASFGAGTGESLIASARGPRDRAQIGAGFSVALSDQVALFGSYNASIAATDMAQRLTAGARVSW